MTYLRRPFEKELEQLVKSLHNAWQGTIIPAADVYSYSKYVTDMKGFRVEVQLVSMGNLTISIYHHFDYRFRIRPEGSADRLEKSLFHLPEPQVGNPQFDDKFSIEVVRQEDKAPLLNPALQSLIRLLEPFSELKVAPGRLNVDLSVTEAEQLNYETVTRDIEALMQIAQILSESTK